MATDYLIDADTGDLKVEGGDLVVGFSDAQNLTDLVETHKGEIKVSPLVGVGVSRMAKKRQGAELLLGDTRAQLDADGWIESDVDFEGLTLEVNAKRPADED